MKQKKNTALESVEFKQAHGKCALSRSGFPDNSQGSSLADGKINIVHGLDRGFSSFEQSLPGRLKRERTGNALHLNQNVAAAFRGVTGGGYGIE